MKISDRLVEVLGVVVFFAAVYALMVVVFSISPPG